jgi:hypothetical protein
MIASAGPFELLALAGYVNQNSLQCVRSTNKYARITDAAQTGLDFATTFTLEGWFRFDSLPTNGNAFGLICKYDVASAAQHSYFTQLANISGVYRWTINATDSSDNADQVYWAVTPSIDTWYHAAFTCDVSQTGAAATFKLYLDGVDRGASTVQLNNDISAIRNGTANFTVGRRGSQHNFDGKIDHVRAWPVVRTQPQIDANKDQRPAITTEAGSWLCDEIAPGLELIDEVGNNNLVLINTAGLSSEVPF